MELKVNEVSDDKKSMIQKVNITAIGVIVKDNI